MKIKFLKPTYELSLIENGEFNFIVGIDEVGRGSWAGPVAVGAYIFDTNCLYRRGIQDSKLLNIQKRENKYKFLSCDKYFVKFGEVEEINSIGIGKTLERIISDIVEEVNDTYKKSHIVIDGQFKKNFGENTIKRIKADSTYYSVAAASILAKVERDSLMRNLHSTFPNYGFNTNVGYPTKRHIKALDLYGPTEIHRTSFAPIGKLLESQNLEL